MSERQAEYITEASELMGWKEEKQIQTEFSGFVMIYDCVLKRYGNLTKAAVHGAILRYCGMEDRVCKASLKSIGEMIGVDKATVMRYAKELCVDGYLKDLTPDLRNRPHIYADTGAVQIKNKLTVAHNNATVAPCNATVAQNQLTRVNIKDIKKQEIKEGAKERATPKKAKDFPEVMLVHSVMGRYPARDTWDMVCDAVEKVQKRLGRPPVRDDLLPFWRFWRIKGWSIKNLSWLTDLAVSGNIPTNGNGHKPSVQQSYDAIDRVLGV